MPTIIIIGASSGLGHRLTEDFAKAGWRIGIAARRKEELLNLKNRYQSQIEYSHIDITSPDSVEHLNKLIETMGGIDVLLLASGIGKQNPHP